MAGPNDEPYLGVPDEEIENLTLANYKHETAYLLSGLHEWLMRLLEKRLEGKIITVLDKDDSPKAKYAELFVHGGIEAIRDSILPDILTERYNRMERHTYRACSVSRVNDLAYVRLRNFPQGQLIWHLYASIALPDEILEKRLVRLPMEPSTLWQVDLRDAVDDFKLEVSPNYVSADRKRLIRRGV